MKYYIPIGLGILLGVSACDSDFEKVPVEDFTIEYVFSKTDSVGKNAHYFLNDIYGEMLGGHNRVGGDYLDAATDDAVTSALNETDVYKLSVGRYSPTNIIGSDMRWGEYYRGIRKVNIFINNIDVVPLMTRFDNNVATNIPMNRAWKAEARFLRAYFYFELLKRYGGVPLVGDKPFELNDNLELPRNNFEQCVDYIVGELDAIKDSLRSLPLANAGSDAHVATQEAAMAFKSRVLLYAASPLFNENPLEKSNLLVGYPSYDVKRWEKAANAAKYFIEKYPNYTLASDYKNVFLNYFGTNNPELIFFHQSNHGKEIEQNNGPVGFTGENQGKGRTSPSQNLVDAFLMKDGKPIGESKYTYSYETMYQNRDPRLNMTILHNESRWLNKIMATYEGGVNNPAGTNQKTKTSYYMRKFMGNFENNATYDNTLHLWVMYRYAEILLNYAEALNECNDTPAQEVYDVLIALRKRAGIEEGDDGLYGLVKTGMDKTKMRKIIQNERRIEMAFEEQRYWDIRRWRIAEEVFSKPVRGMKITKTGSVIDYVPTDVLTTSFDVKRYLYPIPYSEVIKNKNMVQNPKWN